MTDGSTTWTYTYNADGLRTKRTNGTTIYSYVYNGSSLTQMTVGSDTLYFAYDGSSPMAVTYNGTNYYYATNLQGDVVAILNSSGTAVVQYTYDAWGNILTTTGSMATTLGAINPLTYRGYVFDRETGLYYLQSRYYNPEIGRFINADALVSTGQGMLGNNMFAYCIDNPVNYSDYLGYAPGDWFISPDEAAIDFSEYINEKSIDENCEYASYIHKVKFLPSWLECLFLLLGMDEIVEQTSNVYYYTYIEPQKGATSYSRVPINWFGIDEVVAIIHTHGAYDPAYLSDIFSPGDKAVAERKNIPIYVATPLGELLKYNPFTNYTAVISTVIPFDPNHPLRKND